MKKRIFLSLAMFLSFVLLENPAIPAKLAHINTQQIFWGKSIVLIGAEVLLYMTLVFASFSKLWIKIGVLGLVICSTLLFDTYYAISHKVIEYQEFLLLFQSRANLLDGIKMYAGAIWGVSPKIILLVLGFVLMPPPLLKGMTLKSFFRI